MVIVSPVDACTCLHVCTPTDNYLGSRRFGAEHRQKVGLLIFHLLSRRCLCSVALLLYSMMVLTAAAAIGVYNFEAAALLLPFYAGWIDFDNG